MVSRIISGIRIHIFYRTINVKFCNIFSFSIGFLSILLMTMVTGVFSVVIRSQLLEEQQQGAMFYVSMMALVNSSIISSLWVIGNPQLRSFTVEKIKTLFCVSEVD